MQKHEIEQLVEKCNSGHNFTELFNVLEECGYIIDGKAVCVKVARGEDGHAQARLVIYGDINQMSLEDLEDYYEELEITYGELQDGEPDDPYSEEYDEWVEKITELENQMYAAEARISHLKG